MTLAELDAMQEALEEEHFDWLASTRYCPRLPGLMDLVHKAQADSDGTVRGFAAAAERPTTG